MGEDLGDQPPSMSGRNYLALHPTPVDRQEDEDASNNDSCVKERHKDPKLERSGHQRFRRAMSPGLRGPSDVQRRGDDQAGQLGPQQPRRVPQGLHPSCLSEQGDRFC